MKCLLHGLKMSPQEFRSEVVKAIVRHGSNVTQQEMNCIFRDLIVFCRISLPFVISGSIELLASQTKESKMELGRADVGRYDTIFLRQGRLFTAPVREAARNAVGVT